MILDVWRRAPPPLLINIAGVFRHFRLLPTFPPAGRTRDARPEQGRAVNPGSDPTRRQPHEQAPGWLAGGHRSWKGNPRPLGHAYVPSSGISGCWVLGRVGDR